MCSNASLPSKIIRAELRRRGTLVNVEDAGDGFVVFVSC